MSTCDVYMRCLHAMPACALGYSLATRTPLAVQWVLTYPGVGRRRVMRVAQFAVEGSVVEHDFSWRVAQACGHSRVVHAPVAHACDHSRVVQAPAAHGCGRN